MAEGATRTRNHHHPMIVGVAEGDGAHGCSVPAEPSVPPPLRKGLSSSA